MDPKTDLLRLSGWVMKDSVLYTLLFGYIANIDLTENIKVTTFQEDEANNALTDMLRVGTSAGGARAKAVIANLAKGIAENCPAARIRASNAVFFSLG